MAGPSRETASKGKKSGGTGEKTSQVKEKFRRWNPPKGRNGKGHQWIKKNIPQTSRVWGLKGPAKKVV